MSFRHTFLFNKDFPQITPHINEWCATCKLFQPSGRDTQVKHCSGCHKNLDIHAFPVLKFPKSFKERAGVPLVIASSRCFNCFREFYKGVDYQIVRELPKEKAA